MDLVRSPDLCGMGQLQLYIIQCKRQLINLNQINEFSGVLQFHGGFEFHQYYKNNLIPAPVKKWYRLLVMEKNA